MPQAGARAVPAILVAALAVLAALPPVAPPAAATPVRHSGASQLAPPLAPPGSPATVTTTFFVGNETSTNGNVLPGDGLLPYCVAFDPAHDRLYVGNWGTNFVTVLNATTRAVESYFPVGVNGTEALLVANDSLYVVGWNLVLVQVFNLTTLSLVANVNAGSGPWAEAFNPQQGLVYVTMDSSNALEAISDANHSVVIDQPVRASPQSVAYDPASHEVFVGDDGDTVSVLNATTLAYVTNLTVGAAPWSMVYDPANGRVYVANQDNASFSVIDGQANALLGTYGLGAAPNATALDPTGSWLYIANGDGNNITAVNTSNLSDRRDLRLGAGPTGLAYDGALGELVTTNFETNNLTFLDPTTGRIDATVVNGVTPSGLAYDPSDGLAYVADGSGNSVVGLNTTSGAWTRRIAVPAGPALLRYDASTRDLWALSPPSAALVRIDPVNGTVLDRYSVEYGAVGLAIDAHDGLAFVSSTRSSTVAELTLGNGSTVGSLDFLDPTALTYCPSTGLLYVLDGFASERVSAVDPASGRTLARAGVGLIASGIVCDPFGRDIFVSNSGSANVTVLDAHTLAEAGAISVAIGGTGADYDWRNAELAISSTFNPPTSGHASDPDPLTLLGTVNRTSAGVVTVGAGADSVLFLPPADGFLVANALSGTLSLVAPGTPPPTLVSVTVTPTARAIQSGATDPFNGSTVSDYGIPLLEGLTLAWTCVPSSLGTVLPPDAPTVKFTAGATAQNGSLVLTVTYGTSTVTASAAIEVLPAPPSPLATVTVSPTNVSVYVGATAALTATARLLNGDPAPPSTGFVWSVSPASIGSLNVTTGTSVALTGRAPGTGQLLVTAFGNGAPVSATANVTITLSPGSSVALVVIAPGPRLNVTWGSSTAVHAFAYSLNGTNLSTMASFAWSLTAPPSGSLQPNGTGVNYLAPSRNATDVLSVSASYRGTESNASITIGVIAIPPSSYIPPGPAPSPWTAPLGPLPAWEWLVIVLAAGAVVGVLAWRRRGRRVVEAEVIEEPSPPSSEPGLEP